MQPEPRGCSLTAASRVGLRIALSGAPVSTTSDPGDTLLIRALDRLAGTEKMAIETIHELDELGVLIKSLTEPAIDTTSAMGRALYGIVAVFAQLRVDTIRENTRRGLEYARTQGRVGGRPTVMTAERIATARQMREQKSSFATIGRVLGVGASSVRRALDGPAEGVTATEGE